MDHPRGGSDRISFFYLLTRTLIEVFSRPRFGPLAQYIHRYGLPSLSPLQIVYVCICMCMYVCVYVIFLYYIFSLGPAFFFSSTTASNISIGVNNYFFDTKIKDAKLVQRSIKRSKKKRASKLLFSLTGSFSRFLAY